MQLSAAEVSQFRVALLNPQMVHDYWGEIVPHLNRIDFPDHTIETLYNALIDVDKRMYLFAIINNNSGNLRAVIGVELLETVLEDRWLSISFVAGKDVDRWISVVEPLVLNWARGFECTRAVGRFRKAFKKFLPDWKHTHDYLELEL